MRESLSFKIFQSFNQLSATKRNILSASSRLFDPMGILGPTIIRTKMLLQYLWIKKIDWDESIPMNVETAWSKFKADIPGIAKLHIPRFVGTEKQARIQIHGFADASVRAYGC